MSLKYTKKYSEVKLLTRDFFLFGYPDVNSTCYSLSSQSISHVLCPTFSRTFLKFFFLYLKAKFGRGKSANSNRVTKKRFENMPSTVIDIIIMRDRDGNPQRENEIDCSPSFPYTSFVL